MGNLVLTSDALQLLDRIRQDHGEVVLYQSSGCVCGDAPQCFSKPTFLPGSNDYRLETSDGSVCLWRSGKLDRGVPPEKIVISTTPGRRGGFALENLYERLFLVQHDNV